MTLQGVAIPLGFTAADARARGDDVDPSVPDCAEAWCYGWEAGPNEHDFAREGMGLKITMTAILPFWRYITLNVSCEAPNG